MLDWGIPARLVYIYGPPASGKLTIAQALAQQTGFALFHNHLTVNAVREVFPFGSPAFERVVHRLRLDVFAEAAGTGIDLIFTSNSAWGGDDGRQRFAAFADATAKTVADAGGTICFVRVTAPSDVIVARAANPSRTAHGKLTDPERLARKLATFDESSLHADDLVVDSSALAPDDAAAVIASALAART